MRFPTVAVIVNTHNQAHFLAAALDSVFAQSRLPDEVIVVDDGSTDDATTVVKRYPDATFMRQQHAGLSAARNAGLLQATSKFIIFLDADDRLLPQAIEHGLARFEESPDCALVYGGHRFVDVNFKPTRPDKFDPIGEDPYCDFLRANPIGMHATVMYRRDVLVQAGGFSTDLGACEDYDIYLRLSRSYPIGTHAHTVAEYRFHGDNMSLNNRAMLRAVLTVLNRQKPVVAKAEKTALAWRAGKRWFRNYYGDKAIEAAVNSYNRDASVAMRTIATIADCWWTPRLLVQHFTRRIRNRLERKRQTSKRVNLGDFATTQPMSRDFGFDRGLPVDRYYIEDFLKRHTKDICGHVLEVGDDTYSKRFGRDLQTIDVLHVHNSSGKTTIVGDLATSGTLPRDRFDCIILTQTLHLIFDLVSAVSHLHGSLKSGGVLLATVPGISQIDRGEWRDTWYWALTPASARRLFGEAFGDTKIEIVGKGNVFAACTFLHGLAVEELDRKKLDVVDEAYPVIVTIRAMKA